MTGGDEPGFPVTLSEPGSYRLTGALTAGTANVRAIEITADDVTLDLNGFLIKGPLTNPSTCSGVPPSAGIGIVSSAENTSVSGGSVRAMTGHGLDLGRSAHVERHAPPGVDVEARPVAAAAWPYLMASDHPGNLAARKVLRELYGREPYEVRLGGSIPVVPLFRNELGADTVNFAFALQDENFHAPDEFFRLSSFDCGQRAYCRLLEELGAV